VTIPFHTVPSLIALAVKLVLFVYVARSRTKSQFTRLFLVLLLLFSAYNVIEFSGISYYYAHGFNHTVELFGFSYFAIFILCTAIILHLSLIMSFDAAAEPKWKHYFWLLYIFILPLEYLLFFTDQLVVGFAPFKDSIIRKPGPLYFLFESYMVGYLLASFVNLLYGARSSRAPFKRNRNRLWLLGLLPVSLMFIYLIVAGYFGLPKFTTTFYHPIGVTFFLVVTTYAIHEYRLFDIEFFVPWSKVRKRKTAFYQRIQATIAEIADLPSVREILEHLAKVLHCQVALIGGPRPLVALVEGQESSLSSQLALSQFPREALQRVNHIVVANEIADSLPELHALMKHHKVGAIVPFNSHSATSAHWMLLGEYFSDQVYTPLDFRVVEALFDKLAERFIDNLLLLRSQLADANDELRDYKRRLAMAWQDLAVARKKSVVLETTNRELREEIAGSRRKKFHVVAPELPVEVASGEKTLEAFLAAFLEDTEATLVRAALKVCHGDKGKAARLLGIADKRAMFYLMQRHQINERDFS
jgi:hypothetical protein